MVSTKNITRSNNMTTICVPNGDCAYILKFILDQNNDIYSIKSLRTIFDNTSDDNFINKEYETIYTHFADKLEKLKYPMLTNPKHWYRISDPKSTTWYETYFDSDELFDFLIKSMTDPDVQYYLDNKHSHAVSVSENPPYLDPVISMKNLSKTDFDTQIFTPICVYGDVLKYLLIENRIPFQVTMTDICFKDKDDEMNRKYWAKRFEITNNHIFVSPNTMLCFKTRFDPDELFEFLISAISEPTMKLYASQHGLKDHISYIGAIE